MEKRNVQLGTFYGYKLTLEVPKNQEAMPDEWFIEQYQNHIELEKRRAVEEYKDRLFFREIAKKKEKEETLGFKLFKKIFY